MSVLLTLAVAEQVEEGRASDGCNARLEGFIERQLHCLPVHWERRGCNKMTTHNFNQASVTSTTAFHL